MTIKAKKIIGNNVITLSNGSVVAKVNDVVFDPITNRVRALLVDEGSWFSDAKVILVSDIRNIGEDAIMIASEDFVKKASEVEERVSNIAKDDKYLTKTKIVTETGKELGHISDIVFDTSTGNVMEFEVSGGFFNNITSGPRTVKIADVITVGNDATIVRAQAEEKIDQQSQKQGLQGAFNTAKETVGNIADQVKEKANEFGDKASKVVDNMAEKAKDPKFHKEVKDKASELKDDVKENFDKAKAKFI